MRVLPLTMAALQFVVLAGCDAGPANVAGDAGPAGSPAAASARVSPSAATTSAPPSTPASRRPTTPTTVRAKTTAPTATATTTATSGIRATDWRNVTLADLSQYGDITFKNGTGATGGADNCTMLPGGARPFYAEYLAEEPANSPVTEDALILIDCGSDMQQQALVPVKLGYDQKTRQTMGYIKADPPAGPDQPMTFTSYRVQGSTIVTTVKKTDGSTETRRYRYNGGINWERY
ncbi:hypothetical protein ACQPZJ_13070 [Actinoplanes sp. CA-054009]